MPSQIPLTSKEESYVNEFCRERLSSLYRSLPKCKRGEILYEIKFTTPPKHNVNLREQKPREIHFDTKRQKLEDVSLEVLSDLNISKIKFVHSCPPVSVRYLLPNFTEKEKASSIVSKFPGKVFTCLVAEEKEFNNGFKIKLSSLYKMIFNKVSLHRSNMVLKLNDLLISSGFDLKDVNSSVSFFAENKFKDVYSFQL